ncbi:hypothetical protein FDB39_16975 [Clostridium botulinum]|nr:hypothetical protein [Clostridium botulinum]
METNIKSVQDFKEIKESIKVYDKIIVNSYAYENYELTKLTEEEIKNMLEKENEWLMCYSDTYGIMESASLNIKFSKKI